MSTTPPSSPEHFHSRVALGATPQELIRDINALTLVERAENSIRIGELLNVLFADAGKGSRESWGAWKFEHLTFDEAGYLMRMAVDPVYLKYLSSYPPNRWFQIELFQFRVAKADLFIKSILDGHIHPKMLPFRSLIKQRTLIRHLKTYGMPEADYRKAQLAAILSNPAYTTGYNIDAGDFRDLWRQRIQRQSVKLILTDPLWNEPKLYGDLAAMAVEILRPDGVCLAYASYYYLPEILDEMRKHLAYIGINVVSFWERQRPRHDLRQALCYQMIVVFGKQPGTTPVEMMRSNLTRMIEGEHDKEYHKWGQGVREFRYFMEKYSAIGDHVVDPFLGGGPCAVAAKQTGRLFWGCDIDEDAARKARARVAAVEADEESADEEDEED